jgi:hypothetical protein
MNLKLRNLNEINIKVIKAVFFRNIFISIIIGNDLKYFLMNEKKLIVQNKIRRKSFEINIILKMK